MEKDLTNVQQIKNFSKTFKFQQVSIKTNNGKIEMRNQLSFKSFNEFEIEEITKRYNCK